MIFSFLLSEAGSIPPPPTDPWSLVQYGILGVLVAALITRKGIVPEWIFKRDEADHIAEKLALEERHAGELKAKDARIASLESQVERLQDVTLREMIPALSRATTVAAAYNEELARQRHREESAVDPGGRRAGAPGGRRT